jgi:gliding motility-associated protein GldC
MKTSEIKFLVTTDENRLPVEIKWEAEDAGSSLQQTKSVMISLWDGGTQNTLRIDLWTKDMLVDEMKLFFYQTMLSMANTDFCNYFAEKMQLDVTPPPL